MVRVTAQGVPAMPDQVAGLKLAMKILRSVAS